MRSAPPALLPILRSQVAGDLLALLFLHPGDEYSLTEAARAIGASTNTVHYEAAKLSEGRLIKTRKRGNLRLIRAATDLPLTRPLTDLLAVTYGPLPVLTDLIANVGGITEAYIYGSWAARYSGEPGPVPADVDVLVVGTPDPDKLDEVADEAQTTLHRPVNIRRLRPETWNASNPADPFIASVKSRPLVTIVGSTRVLGRPSHEMGAGQGRIMRQFNRMRTRGHDAEYPPTDSPEITPDDVREDQKTAVGLIDLAARLLDEMSPF